MAINIYKDYVKAELGTINPGGGYEWINFNMDISIDDSIRLKKHIINCAKLSIRKDADDFRINNLYLTSTPPLMKDYLVSIKSSISHSDQATRQRFIDDNKRYFGFATTLSSIVGIRTDYGLPTLTVDEVAEIKRCMENYEDLETLTDRIALSNPVVLETLTCPISQLIFYDPVVASDGITYSKSSLDALIKRSPVPKSPISREELKGICPFEGKKVYYIPNSTVNHILDKVIQGKLQMQGGHNISYKNKYLKYKKKYTELSGIKQ